MAFGAFVLSAPAALAATPRQDHAKALERSHAQIHWMDPSFAPHACRQQPQNQVDDPLSSLLLG
ncbi:hypothetical protein AYJ54_44190 [Bradyrhizobium centrolobii]|uniref:Uncharacterized protein n=1 Tax=Bradyrhizobium centrolobii TaxID=1505087 RepID=A0A176YZM3_9BRAD|nr:hypothetical protein AYJ54_44190 [Bradyrhizobium centrolobii]